MKCAWGGRILISSCGLQTGSGAMAVIKASWKFLRGSHVSRQGTRAALNSTFRSLSAPPLCLPPCEEFKVFNSICQKHAVAHLFPALFSDTNFEKAHRCSSANGSADDAYESWRFVLPLKGIISKCMGGSLFRARTTKVIRQEEYDSLIKVHR